MFGKPGIILRIEGAILFVLVLVLYRVQGGGWGLFFLLFLWPDLFMLGYLANVRRGAALYNLAHTLSWPAVLAGGALLLHRNGLLSFALIWIAHIEFDRALGYVLKFPTFFQDTHLQRVNSAVGSPGR